MEEVALVCEVAERANGSEHPMVVRPQAFDEDGDVAGFELVHDLAECMRAGCVEYGGEGDLA